ncbi:MAG: DNA polymerase II [Candidatus Tectomicrobia bacterium]|nr:DNA polymerase II [Candidatus Tectomicrobia bacterium]
MSHPPWRLSPGDNRVLYGHGERPGIVAVEPEGEAAMRLFLRSVPGGGELRSEVVSFTPFLLLNAEALPHLAKLAYDLEELAGDGFYRHLARFPTWGDFELARKAIQRGSGVSPGDPASPQLALGDPVHQYLLLSGETSFKGLEFADLHRLQLDIETACSPGFEFPNPLRPADRVIAISVSDSRGFETVLKGTECDEPELLRRLAAIIRERNPDVIEGHNLCRFDLPYLAARAERCGVALSLGRDGSVPKRRSSRLSIAERTIDYPRWDIYGRHIIDTWMLAQFYDIGGRDLEGYGLKEVARAFKVAAPQRTYIEGSQITSYFERQPETLFAYCLDDARETRAISELLSPSYFLQARMFPYSFQNVAVRGNATKIDALLLREYLRQRQSIPRQPQRQGRIAGGYTATFQQGVAKNVVSCDVQSLYPSIMLSYDRKPRQDRLNIFQDLLRDLRALRLGAKKLAASAEREEERRSFHTLQATFKVLINSFYGYLGAGFSHFADYEAAAAITATGRELLQRMIDWLRDRDCRIIEIDTDGIYFVPPPQLGGEAQAAALVAELSEAMPEGIDVECAGHYRAMFSYKSKNYALLDSEGEVRIKGSGLRSRGLELFQRDFLRRCLELVLSDRRDEVEALYTERLAAIAEGRMGIQELAKTETLQDSLETYRGKIAGKKRNRSAPYELALRAERAYQPGDQLSYYVTGEKANVAVYETCKLVSDFDPAHPDFNVAYYQKKLKDLYKKFTPYFHELAPAEGEVEGEAESSQDLRGGLFEAETS